jgi:phosphatidate cytidylyltransferase
MLKQRVITAILLLAVFVPSVLARNTLPFLLVTLLLIACGAWEWSRLNGFSSVTSIVLGAAGAGLCLAAWFSGWLGQSLPLLWWFAGTAWVLIGGWLLGYGQVGWMRLPKTLRLAAGLLALAVAFVALLQARAIGVNFLLSVLSLVWMADIGAYFAGRTFGGRFFANKLAPSISPGKTWEGVVGGVVGVLVLASLWVNLEAHWTTDSISLYGRLLTIGVPYLLVSVVFLSAMSVVGDLVESLFKRLAGVKDSSGLLPGHGGVLDRLDALLPTLPLAMMIVSWGTP